MEKEESEEQSKAAVADSADKTEVLCQKEKYILITRQTEQGFRKNHIINLDNRDQGCDQQHHHNTVIIFSYFNYPYLQKCI